MGEDSLKKLRLKDCVWKQRRPNEFVEKKRKLREDALKRKRRQNANDKRRKPSGCAWRQKRLREYEEKRKKRNDRFLQPNNSQKPNGCAKSRKLQRNVLLG